AVIDEEQVGAIDPFGPGSGTGDGDVDIQEPIVIDVHHRCARTPPVGLDPGALGDVLELQVACVPIQAARDHVAAEEDVRQAVVIDVAHGDAGAVVDVDVVLDVEGIVGRDGVRERDAGLPRGEQPEDGRGRFAAAARHGDQQQHTDRVNGSAKHGHGN